MTYTDIRKPSWIELFPAKIRPYFYLMRLDRPIGVWLLLLPSLWGIALASGGHHGVQDSRVLWISFLFFIGAFIMRGAGCIINDLWDTDLDKKVERTKDRPIPSGKVSQQQAMFFLIFLLFLGFWILSRLPMITVLLGFFALPFIVAYPLMKRVTFWPQAFLGVTFNLGILLGWSSIVGSLSLSALILYLGAIFWTLAYDTIYAYQDKDDDIKANIKSTALIFGQNGKMFVGLFYVISLFLIACAGFREGAGLFFIVGLWCAALYVFWELKRWKMDDRNSALEFFKANTVFGILVLASIILCFI